MHLAGAAGDLLLRRPERPDSAAKSEGAVAVKTKAERRSLSAALRPYRVIGGLVLSFSVVTLLGSALLSVLHLPQDAIRWVALVALVAIGVGLIFPRFEQLLERPFSRIPQKQFDSRGSGFGLGLALGVLYVPCAGPVLAAIVVAGATATIGVGTVVLTAAFAIGAALPLLFFALAGKRIAERVNAFRRRQREIRIGAGIVTILLAVALVFNLPAMLQRAIPDYTASLQERVGGSDTIREKLNLGGIVNDQNARLSNCSNGARELESCGTAPDLRGIEAWLNTPDGRPVTLESLRGKVVLIDFWAYSCINCQRAIPTSSAGIRPTKTVGWKSSACTPPSTPSNGSRATSSKGRPISASPIRLRWTTATPPGRITAIGTGGGVSDRRQRHRASHQVRRGRLRRHRSPDPAAAGQRQARRHAAKPVDAPDLTHAPS